MARPKKIVEESQEVVDVAETVEPTSEPTVKVEEKVEAPVEEKQETVAEQPAPSVELAKVEEKVEEVKVEEKPAKKPVKVEKTEPAPAKVESKPAVKASESSSKSYIVNSIPAYMAANFNSAFGLISGLFVAQGEIVNGDGASFTSGYTIVPGAGGQVKVFVRTQDLK